MTSGCIRQDIAGSTRTCQHAAAACGIITDDPTVDAIHGGLGSPSVPENCETGDFVFSEALEDIHMNIESRLAELIGEPARRLHTARSRNDQVATDFKLWVRDLLDSIDHALADMQAALLDAGRSTCRFIDARFHPSSNRPAGDIRVSPDGLC